MISTFEKAAYLLIIIVIALGSYLAHFHPDAFRHQYVNEDGPLESATAILLFLSGLLMLSRAIRLRAKRGKLFLTMTTLAALVMFFGAGEEISWGQRIFDIETPEALMKHNKQGETNLHNLMVGGVNINKLVFSKLLALGLVTYLLVLPPLIARKPKLKRLSESFAIPMPTTIQTIMWIVALALPELIINSSKKGEVRETCAGLIILVTFLSPRNRHIYDASRDTPHPTPSDPPPRLS